MTVEIDVSILKQSYLDKVSDVIISELKKAEANYINILFVENSKEFSGEWDQVDLDYKLKYVKEIIFNDQTKTHKFIDIMTECINVISKANISEAVFNGFDNKTLNDVFKKSYKHLKKIDWLRIENTKELKFETLQQLKDNSIVSKKCLYFIYFCF